MQQLPFNFLLVYLIITFGFLFYCCSCLLMAGLSNRLLSFILTTWNCAIL